MHHASPLTAVTRSFTSQSPFTVIALMEMLTAYVNVCFIWIRNIHHSMTQDNDVDDDDGGGGSDGNNEEMRGN